MKLRTKLPFLAATGAASAIAWIAFADTPVPGGPPSATGIQHVVLITVDGLRGDLLKNLMDSPAGAATYPNFNRLRSEGASTFEARCDFDYSETLPNHVSVVTGRPVLQPARCGEHGASRLHGELSQCRSDFSHQRQPKHLLQDQRL